MPTPFYHLSVALELLNRPTLPAQTRHFLLHQRSAFLLGNTAPDVQVISKQARQDTHFYSIPLRDDEGLAWERMLESHPGLAVPGALPTAQAAFLAGYLCHLQADVQWVREIFEPVFGPDQVWGTFRQRLYLHNVLRAFLDHQALRELPANMSAELGGPTIAGWLPFVEDLYLEQWRRFLAEQLQPGAAARTVEVFARRQGLAVDKFYALLDSEDRMEAEIFSHLPLSRLVAYRHDLLEANIQLLPWYLSNRAREEFQD